MPQHALIRFIISYQRNSKPIEKAVTVIRYWKYGIPSRGRQHYQHVVALVTFYYTF
jgi:hypothetical protein